MKKVLLLLAWFPATSLCLLVSLYLLSAISTVKGGSSLVAYEAREMIPKNGYQFYASLPDVLGGFSSAVATGDARPELVRQFMVAHGSPMEPYAELMVAASDAQGIDFRLLPAIAMCESNLGKKMPEDSYNAWGYAIYTGQNSGAAFEGWKEAIDTMARYIYNKYYSRGLTTPEAMGPIYAPPSVNTDNSWAKCVRSFMDELE